MRQQYLADLPERLDDIEASILELENTDQFQQVFEKLYRDTHSLKGSAGTHGLHIITTIAHHLESNLNYVGNDQAKFTPQHQGTWLKFIDLFRNALSCIERGIENFSDIEQELERLRLHSTEKPFRCLLVESSSANAALIKKIMADLPIHIEISHNSYEALHRLLLENFDLLISGTQMPVLNGHALIAALKLSGSVSKNLTTVLLSSDPVDVCDSRISPDYIILRDLDFITNFHTTVNSIITKNRANNTQ